MLLSPEFDGDLGGITVVLETTLVLVAGKKQRILTVVTSMKISVRKQHKP